jgi:hypothetical protein
LPARNPAENFGRDRWVVDVAVDRHDLFPQATKARIKACYRLGVLTIGSKDIVLEYTVLTALVVARAIYVNPAEALSSGSISDLAENGFETLTHSATSHGLI